MTDEDKADEELESLLTIGLVIVIVVVCSAIFMYTIPSILDFALRYFTP